MASEWPSLLDLCSTIIDNRGKTCPVGKAGRPLIATNCVKDTWLYPSCETQRFVSEETYRSWFRGHPQPGDLIFVTKGSPGQVCLAPNPVDFCIAQDMVALRINASLVYPPYLFALLRTKGVRDQIDNMHVGTMIPHFKKGDFDKLHLQIPDEDVQRFIGDFYLRLSERIDLLAKANESPEAITRAIFKSWFVDFDPVRAKAEGREPEGMDAATAALFPSEFQESVLGPVPAGWIIGRLDDLLVLQRGFDLPQTQRTSGLYPVIAASGPSGTHNEPRVKAPGVVTGRSGVIGKVYWVDDDFWPLNTSLWVKNFKRATPAYAFQLLQLLNLSAYNAGSAVPTLNRNHVHGLPTLLPPADTIRAFDEFATLLYQKIRVNKQYAETLTELRDTLLPRLISGKLRVLEVEKMMEAL